MKITKARVKYYYKCEYLAFYDSAKLYPTPIYGALSVTRSQTAWRPGTCCTDLCSLISW